QRTPQTGAEFLYRRGRIDPPAVETFEVRKGMLQGQLERFTVGHPQTITGVGEGILSAACDVVQPYPIVPLCGFFGRTASPRDRTQTAARIAAAPPAPYTA